MAKTWIVTLIPMILLAGSRSRAEDNLLPLSEVVRRVVAHDPGVRAYHADQDAARSEAKRTETLRLPKLYLNTDVGGGQMVNDVANVLLTGLSPASVTDPKTRSNLANLSANRPFAIPGAHLESLLFDGGRTGAAVRSAWLTENKSGVAQARATQDETYAAAADFLGLAQGRVLDRYLEDHVRVTELVSNALADQAKAGRITDARALAGRAQLQTAQAALENNRDEMRTASDLLRQRAGLAAEAAFDTRPAEDFLGQYLLSPLPEDAELQSNAALQATLLDTQIQEQQVRAAKARRLPELKFVADYGFVFSALVFTYRPAYSVGVRATYPLFTGGEVEKSVQTETRRLDAATLREQKTRSVLQEEYTRLQAENRKLGRQLDAARSQLSQAEELYRIIRLKYDQGATSPTDLLETAELLLNSRERCLELARSSLLLRWAAFRFQGKLLAELERSPLP